MASKLGEAVGFLDKFGLFDVLLPFLLIFTMVFAILERTKIFGTEKWDNQKEPTSRKNLNALFAFCIAFFTIASAKAVSTINKMIGPIMILMLCLILFLMLVSIFEKKDASYTEFSKGTKAMFAVAILVIIILIFLSSIQTGSGQTWLEYVWDLVSSNTDGGVVSAIILILIIGAMIYFVGSGPKPEAKKEQKEDKE